MENLGLGGQSWKMNERSKRLKIWRKIQLPFKSRDDFLGLVQRGILYHHTFENMHMHFTYSLKKMIHIYFQDYRDIYKKKQHVP